MRPLPYIIGTAAFIESRDAGLGDFLDEMDEEEPEVALEHGSDSDVSDTEEYSPPPAVYNSAAPRNTSTASSHYDYDDGDEEEETGDSGRMASVSDAASEDYAAPAPRAKPDNIRNSIAAQLAARRTQISETDSDDGSHRVSDVKPPVSARTAPPIPPAAEDSDEEEESDMFGGEPEDPYSLFGAPKRKSMGVCIHMHSNSIVMSLGCT